MKNILLILPNMEYGGTGRSLENLLILLNKKYNFKVVCSNPNSHGIYDDILKDYIISWPSWFNCFLKSSFLHKIKVFFLRFLNTNIWYFIYKYAVNSLAKKHHIDMVIGYQERLPTHIASSFSGKKVVWIHCVYSEYIRVTKRNDSCCLLRADKIICVSKYSAECLKRDMREEAHKIDYIYNLLDEKNIIDQSLSPVTDKRFQTDHFTVVSIGRYCKVKQFEKIPDIVKSVISNGVTNFKWYIIGDGDNDLMQQTEQKIKDWHLEDYVILLGSKANPYPYIKQSNLLVSTSYSESCPYVVNEAKLLHIPVLSSNYPTAVELINEEIGIISPIEDMPHVLCRLITNENNVYQRLKNTCEKQKYDNTPMLSQLEKLFEE